jgi:hypothetical protein
MALVYVSVVGCSGYMPSCLLAASAAAAVQLAGVEVLGAYIAGRFLLVTHHSVMQELLTALCVVTCLQTTLQVEAAIEESSNPMLGPGDCFAEVAYFTEVPSECC